MDKLTIYKMFFKLIEDSLEWAEEENNYNSYVSGAVDMANLILEATRDEVTFIKTNTIKINNKDEEENC